MPPFSTKEFFYNTSTTLTQHRDTYSFIDPFRFRNALAGKVALITNAHRGIGRASALDFAFAGATVVCVARTMDQLKNTLSELKSRLNPPARSFGFPMDWTDPDSPRRLVQEVEQKIGHIDILLNINRGPHAESFVHTEKFSDWWAALEQNLRTPIALIHAVLPYMIARGNGTIISTTFRSGVFHIPFTTSDSTTHSGIIRFHHGLDDEVRLKGIYSYVVHPGLVASHLDDPELPDNRTHYTLEPRIISEKTRAVAAVVEDRWCGAGLASGTFLALVADPKAKVLSGLYLDAERDLGELIQEVEKGDASRVTKEKLHVLKVDDL